MRLLESPICLAWGDSFTDLKLKTVIVVGAVVCFSLFSILSVLKALMKIATPLLFLKKTECEIYMANLRGVLSLLFLYQLILKAHHNLLKLLSCSYSLRRK